MRRFVISILTGEHVSVIKPTSEPYLSIARDISSYGASIKVHRVYADGHQDSEEMDGQLVLVVHSTDERDPRSLFRQTVGKHMPEAFYTVTELRDGDA
jgi:hypothetical protein